MDPFGPRLKEKTLVHSALKQSYIFQDGAWWQVVSITDGQLRLRECTNLDAMKIIRHPGMIVFTNKKKDAN